jgi:hypothetical protein
MAINMDLLHVRTIQHASGDRPYNNFIRFAKSFKYSYEKISFRVKAKDSSDFFSAKLKIEGKDFNEIKNIDTNKPIIIPLHTD